MAELGIVDALARLQLAARRSGYELTVTDAPNDLLELIELAGLCEVLGVAGGTEIESPDDAGRPDAASSGAPIATAIDAPCVLASERPSPPGDERRPADHP